MAGHPKVRSACEYCHKRKIRCVFLADGNACHNCAANRITCLFAPRAKVGRPTRRMIYSPQRQLGETNASSEAGEGLEIPDDSLDTSLGVNDDGTMSEETYPLKALQMPPQFLFPFCRQWPDEITINDLSLPSTAGIHDTLLGLGLPSYTPDSTLNSTTANSTTISPLPATPVLETPPSPKPASYEEQYSPWSNPYQSPTPLDFDVALKLCTDLDTRCRSIQESSCLTDVEAHLAVLDFVCMACIKAQSGSDSASRGLIQAALHKAMEICEMLVRIIAGKSGGAESSMLVQLLLLRRLDIVVSFGRVSFARTIQTNGVRKAEEIHRSIERLLHLDYSGWM